MPRTNPGLDYFPLDVDIDTDDKIELIEAKHGIVGFAVIIRLFMKIYRNGYYYQWGEKEQLLFSKRLNVDINTLNVIIEDAMVWGIFHRDTFDQWQILTSKGIQKRYLEATKRRQQVELAGEYLLLDNNCLNEHINVLIVNINADNADITTQSKVKESKVKDSNLPEVKMTHYMIKKILESYPSAKVPVNDNQLYKWVQAFDRLMRIDGKTVEEVYRVMEWVYQDDFWNVNIRSPEKLREKWDTLYLQMTRKQRDGKKDAPEILDADKIRERYL